MEQPIQFKIPVNAMCACPEEVLSYICTIKGSNTTIWGGSAFNCATAGNEINLIHPSGTSGECNNGAILGQSVTVDGTHFTSQLNVTVSSELNNKTVTCSSDSGNTGESLIKVAGKYVELSVNRSMWGSSNMP